MSTALRFGVTLIVLLALHVCFTVFRQLGDASQLFNEIVHNANGILAYGSEEGFEREMRYDAYRPDYIVYDKKNRRGDRTLQRDPKSSLRDKTDGEKLSEFNPMIKYARQQFRSHFREKIYTVERRIFKSRQKSTTRNFRSETAALPEGPTDTRRNKTFVTSRKEVRDTLSARDDSADDSTTRVSGARVMILAYQRSGSSFIGEMFNRNPEVFYLFEPVQPIEVASGRGKFPLLYDTLVRHLLRVVYTCSFSQHPYLVKFLSSSPFRLKSQILKGLCDANVTAQEMHRCRPIDASRLTALCSSRPHVVMKTIRVSSRKVLEFFSDRETNTSLAALNVLHVVRDPRAIIASRLAKDLWIISKIWPNNSKHHAGNTREAMRVMLRAVRVASSNLCSRIHSDMKHGLKRAGHYAMIRYEDAAMRPLAAYEEVSAFTGMRQAREVRTWLEENTKSDLDPGYYSTSRNATASVHGWRLRLLFPFVKEIQKQCGQLMAALGYVLVQEETHLKDLSKTLVMSLMNDGTLLRKSAINGDLQAFF